MDKKYYQIKNMSKKIIALMAAGSCFLIMVSLVGYKIFTAIFLMAFGRFFIDLFLTYCKED